MFVLLFQMASAQEETSLNQYILGGALNFHIQNNTYPLSTLTINTGIGGIFSNSLNDTKNTSFGISPYFGREINPHLILGLQLEYRASNYKVEDILISGQPSTVDFERNSNQIGVGVFSRHTLNPAGQFNLFVQPYFEYNILNEEESQDTNITQEERANFIELGIDAGVTYKISERMNALLRIGGLQYVNGNWEIVDTNNEKDFSSFGLNINLSTIYLGFEMRI